MSIHSVGFIRSAKALVAAGTLGVCVIAEAKIVVFTYQAQFSDVAAAKVVNFPLDLGLIAPGSITAVVRRGGVDVSAPPLGCSLNMAYRTATDMMLKGGLRNLGTYTATCASGTVATGDVAALTLTIDTTDPVLLIGGSSYVAGAVKTKLSWQHDTGFGFCQAFTMNGWDSAWAPWNYSFNSYTQGETVVSASPTASSTSTYALQCDQHLRTVKMPVR